MEDLISVSSAAAAEFGDKEYYDLVGTLEVLRKVFMQSVVDGFELQLEPEWDRENPPLTDRDWADWTKTPKYTIEEIYEFVRAAGLPILSVHGSRDVGSYICSDRRQDWEKGRRVLIDSLSIAEKLGAEVCVFHLWDTRKTGYDLNRVEASFSEVVQEFPRVKASVENVPTQLEGYTPFELVRRFDFVTLDLRWAAMYKELDKFESIINKVVNVHLRGSLVEAEWVMQRSDFGFYEALDKIRSRWRRSGLLTVEPEGKIDGSMFPAFIKAMRSLRERTSESF